MESQDSVSQQIDNAETLSDLLAVVPAINRGLVAPVPEPMAVWPAADVSKRLQEWLDKLRAKLAQIATELEAESYSVSVGAAAGVSVTVTFGVRDPTV